MLDAGFANRRTDAQKMPESEKTSRAGALEVVVHTATPKPSHTTGLVIPAKAGTHLAKGTRKYALHAVTKISTRRYAEFLLKFEENPPPILDTGTQ